REAAIAILDARPQHTPPPLRGERAEPREPGRDRPPRYGRRTAPLVDPRLEAWPRLPEELQGDVPVLAGHPAGALEDAPPGLDRSFDGIGGVGGHVECDEQPERSRLGPAGTIAHHRQTVRSDTGSGRPSR